MINSREIKKDDFFFKVCLLRVINEPKIIILTVKLSVDEVPDLLFFRNFFFESQIKSLMFNLIFHSFFLFVYETKIINAILKRDSQVFFYSITRIKIIIWHQKKYSIKNISNNRKSSSKNFLEKVWKLSVSIAGNFKW